MDSDQYKTKDDIGNEAYSAEATKFLDSETQKISNGPKFGTRHQQMFMNFTLLAISFSIKVSINVAIVAMTDTTSTNKDIPTYNWTDKQIVISAFFWGYVIPQIVAGWLATRYGPKWFLVVTMMIASLAGFLIPPSAALLGSRGVMICRAVQGFCHGFIIPSVHMLLARWVPQKERSITTTLVYAGCPGGTTVSILLTGYISSRYGWPMSFYFFNGLGLIWAVAFALMGSNTPASHPSITEEERRYIESSLGQEEKVKLSTPWVHILTSRPFWALLVTQCGFIWGFYTLLSEIPLYMNKVMKFDLQSNSLLSSLPYLSNWIVGIVFGYISDKLLMKNIFTVETTRKIMNSIGFVIPAVALIFLGNCGPESTTKTLILMITAVGVNATALSGFYINHIELSPNHAGIIMGFCNGVGNICSIFAPLLVQLLVVDEQDVSQWRVIFYFASAIYLIANFIFIFFGSTKTQAWNDKKVSKSVQTA